MQVRDLMSQNVVSISPDESAALAARLITRYNIGSLPVCASDGALRGIVTDRDIIMRCVAPEENPADTKIRDIMSRKVVTVSPSDDAASASKKMGEHQVRRLPVVEESGRLVGMLSLADLARRQACDTEASQALSEISVGFLRR